MSTMDHNSVNESTSRVDQSQSLPEITILDSHYAVEQESLKTAFGFKGSSISELWQVAVKLVAQFNTGIGLATQSVLYSDPILFADQTEADANQLMYLSTQEAVRNAVGRSFRDPMELFENVFNFQQRKNLYTTTFLLNSLVAFDHAAWHLYAKANKFRNFDQMIPYPYRLTLSHRSDQLAVMYMVAYGQNLSEIEEAAKSGYFIFKIKIGHPGPQSEMLERDKMRLSEVHDVLKQFTTPHTPNSKLAYTLDANARYERKEDMRKLINYAQEIGALEHLLLIEEPFSSNDFTVNDMGVCMAADESVYDEETALTKIRQGYGAIVLKSIAKTLSQTLKIAKIAFEYNIPCICSDLTVTPVLQEWHKNIAARIKPFPGLGMGIIEANGNLNYRDWNKLLGYNPSANASWAAEKNGVFELDEDFYEQSGGIFNISTHYKELFKS